jgi:H+/gluconate symporter-like permease
MAEKVSNSQIFNELMDVSKAVAGMVPIVADLKKAVITGNGTPGLLQRMKTVEDLHAAQSDTKKNKKETSQKWDGRMWALAVSVFLLFAKDVIQLIFK